jgi:hypothetical protein
MEIKANMASYIEQTDLCTCVAGIMMYDKCRDERVRAALYQGWPCQGRAPCCATCGFF